MKTKRAIHQKITQLRQVVNKSQCTWYVHFVWCEGCEKTCKKQQHTKKDHVQNPDPTNTHTRTLTQSVYRCRLTVDGIRIGELSAVTRLKMTSMVAKHCSENAVVFLFICTPLWRWPRRGERGRTWPPGSIHHSANVAHLTSPPTHVKKKIAFGRWLKMSESRQTLSINSSRAYRSAGSPSSPSLKPMATLHC